MTTKFVVGFNIHYHGLYYCIHLLSNNPTLLREIIRRVRRGCVGAKVCFFRIALQLIFLSLFREALTKLLSIFEFSLSASLSFFARSKRSFMSFLAAAACSFVNFAFSSALFTSGRLVINFRPAADMLFSKPFKSRWICGRSLRTASWAFLFHFSTSFLLSESDFCDLLLRSSKTEFN